MGSDHTGLYNGNISWMVTDLKKIGQENGNRATGVQAMLYGYDQLNRIRQSRSLTFYDPNSGFAAHPEASAPYDEDFTYDANGNLLTLDRMDETGAQADDFDYIYYPGTNKLRYLYPITRTKEYDDVITQDNKVYSHIILYKDAYVPEGQSVTIKAIDSIDVEITDEEEFSTIGHGELHAYVLGDDEGAYNYDAIGNLIWDQDLGVQIEWNAYGKVRKVNKSDSTVMTFRYDAAGNRIEKMIITAEQDTSVTRYVRDASGNVMAIYKADSLTEVPIYGSSRIGLYRGGIATGRQMLGHKQYELSNHLGNVLTVITDNVRLDADSAWATVVSVGDYYAFGSSIWKDYETRRARQQREKRV